MIIINNVFNPLIKITHFNYPIKIVSTKLYQFFFKLLRSIFLSNIFIDMGWLIIFNCFYKYFLLLLITFFLLSCLELYLSLKIYAYIDWLPYRPLLLLLLLVVVVLSVPSPLLFPIVTCANRNNF